MERIDLVLANVYYISTRYTLGFELTRFRHPRHPSFSFFYEQAHIHIRANDLVPLHANKNIPMVLE